MVADNYHKADNAAVLCEYFNPHGKTACTLYVNYTIPGQQIGFVFLQRNTSVRLTVPYGVKGQMRIDNEHQFLRYNSFDANHGAMFTLQKKHYMTAFSLAFDLRYYNAYQGFEGTKSGATIFRPA